MMADDRPVLSGIVPERLKVRSARIVLDSLAVNADIGFHDFEVGSPQRLLVSAEVWLEDSAAPADDDPAAAWNYDLLRLEIERIAGERRYNLQETLAHAIFERIAALHGVADLRIRTTKPDVYSDVRGVGVEIASFSGAWPEI
jgi:7,8-dihydroneopterin aldolase/epimerase/oxygenase